MKRLFVLTLASSCLALPALAIEGGWSDSRDQAVGLLINSPRPDLLRFMPALNVSTEEIDQMISMLREVIKTVKAKQ